MYNRLWAYIAYLLSSGQGSVLYYSLLLPPRLSISRSAVTKRSSDRYQLHQQDRYRRWFFIFLLSIPTAPFLRLRTFNPNFQVTRIYCISKRDPDFVSYDFFTWSYPSCSSDQDLLHQQARSWLCLLRFFFFFAVPFQLAVTRPACF